MVEAEATPVGLAEPTSKERPAKLFCVSAVLTLIKAVPSSSAPNPATVS